MKKPETPQEVLSPERHLVKQKETTVLKDHLTSVTFYPNTVYEDVLVDFRVSSDTIHLHEDIIPLQKNFVEDVKM